MRIYKNLITILDGFVPSKLRPLWEHPAGPKTIFFWAPLMKWSIVIAGLNDAISRTADNISVPQNGALLCTGLIWTRYSMVIQPPNYTLLFVNLFIAGVSTVQLLRVTHYRSTHPQK